MKLTLASYELARLASKKGFNHMEANCFGDNMAYAADGDLLGAHKGNVVEGYVLAPTLELLKEWVRAHHDIWVEIHRPYGAHLIHLEVKIKKKDKHGNYITLPIGSNQPYFTDYNDALEYALLKVFKTQI